jgi:hypothetical protein
LLNNPDQAASFAEFGRERIQQEFTRAKMIASIQNAYQDVVDEKKVGNVITVY